MKSADNFFDKHRCRTLSPFVRRAIARSRKSIEIALPTAQPSNLWSKTVNQQNARL